MQDTLQTLSAQLDTIASQLHRADIAERLHEVSFDQQSKGISLAVLGTSGSGKSTLINALLGREVLPTGTTTLTLQSDTIITIAESSKATVTFSNGEKKTVSLAPVTLLNAAKNGNVETLEIQYSSDRWEKGTRIMEVLGINTPYQETFLRVLAQANAVIYVADARQPLNKEEQTLLISIPTHITKCIIALTKFDQIPADEREEALKSAVQQIEDLHVPIKAEVYAVAPQILSTEEYQPALLSAWEDFKQAILEIEPAPFTISPPRVIQINTLRAVAKDLQNALAQSNIEPATSTIGTQQAAEYQKTQDLLNRVISDQTDDIEETLKDSFNAFLFTLRDSLKTGSISPYLIEEQANTWLNKEKTRIETRFRRLYKTVLEDAGRMLDKELNFTPEMLPIPRVTYATAPAQNESSSSFLANLSHEQRSMLIGGAAVAVVGGVLSGPLGWMLIVVGTTGVAGIAIYVMAGRKSGGARQVIDNVDIELPEGIKKNIRHNAQRLKDFLARIFQDASTSVNNSKRDAAALESPFVEKLKDIQTTLDRLSSSMAK
jgi:GTP-binding protein EngB required for normal cell division